MSIHDLLHWFGIRILRRIDILAALVSCGRPGCFRVNSHHYVSSSSSFPPMFVQVSASTKRIKYFSAYDNTGISYQAHRLFIPSSVKTSSNRGPLHTLPKVLLLANLHSSGLFLRSPSIKQLINRFSSCSTLQTLLFSSF